MINYLFFFFNFTIHYKITREKIGIWRRSIRNMIASINMKNTIKKTILMKQARKQYLNLKLTHLVLHLHRQKSRYMNIHNRPFKRTNRISQKYIDRNVLILTNIYFSMNMNGKAPHLTFAH